MNYRHAFHAGNFADVTKHVLLSRMLVQLCRKPTPFRVIDTHAGIGRYDLAASEAERTGEWRDGIGRLDGSFGGEVEALLAPYRQVLAETRIRYGAATYPGSPAILREMLRPQDRAVLVEKHPEDAATLRSRFNSVSNVKVLELDGWTALGGLVPPKERRGLVLVDPPYEVPGELAAAAPRLARTMARWPTGIVALWYPIKDTRDTEAFYRELAATIGRGILRTELFVEPADRTRLTGSGLAIINPPWRLAEEAALLLAALGPRLARRDGGAVRCELIEPGAAPA